MTEKYTRQTAFDTAVKGLYAQGDIAMDRSCKFRALNGNKCAVGMLITDDVYSEMMEDEWLPSIFEDFKDFRNLFVENKITPAEEPGIRPRNMAYFLLEMQGDLHDDFNTEETDEYPYKEWLIDQAVKFAKEHKLEFNREEYK